MSLKGNGASSKCLTSMPGLFLHCSEVDGFNNSFGLGVKDSSWKIMMSEFGKRNQMRKAPLEHAACRRRIEAAPRSIRPGT
jgi:hypothetical protein